MLANPASKWTMGASLKDSIFWVHPIDTRIEIDWDCPCLKKVREGPCGLQFKDALNCFNKSREPDRGSDCVDYFLKINECIKQHPEKYGNHLETKSEASKNNEQD